MAKRDIRNRIAKALTPEERDRHRRIREQIETERPRLNEVGLRARQEHERRVASLREIVAALKATREELGLSLAQVGERMGIDKANLSRLENAPNPNPTIETLSRYAEALGQEIIITLAEKN